MFHKLLIAYFGGFIFFWFLGLDQLYFPFICVVGFFTYLSAERSDPGLAVIFFAIFVVATFFSVFQISSADRYITYIRNEGVYIAMLFVIVSASFASAKEGDITDKLYFALLIFSIQCTVVAFLASQGFSIAFKSVMAIKAYFIHKFWRDGFKILAALCLVAIYMDIFSIYSSLSRSTWISMAFALIVFPFVFKTSMVTKLIPAIVGVSLISIVYLTGLNEGIESRLFDKTHSNEGRGLNYSLIWQETTSSADKLLFGHGTQIDHWQLGIPLGSHSTYLGVFFKFGIIGSVFLALFLFVLYRRSVLLTKNVNRLNGFNGNYKRPYFLCFALLIPVVQMIFIEVDVDLSYALYFSALVFLISQEIDVVNLKFNRLGLANTV